MSTALWCCDVGLWHFLFKGNVMSNTVTINKIINFPIEEVEKFQQLSGQYTRLREDVVKVGFFKDVEQNMFYVLKRSLESACNFNGYSTEDEMLAFQLYFGIAGEN